MVSLCVVARGQRPPSGFDVASIKASAGVSEQALLQALPGRLVMRNFAPRALILVAWGLEAYQVSGGPSWLTTDHYDIEAKADANPSVRQMEGPMLQTLIEDRFQLTFHRETRQMAGFDLKLAASKAKMQLSKDGSCVPYVTDAPPPLAPAPGQAPALFCGYPRYGGTGLNRTLDGKAIGMGGLTNSLIRAELHRPVVNRTGLAGLYDLHLAWTSDSSSALDSSDAVSIFTALREQLGLKLESVQTSVEVVVIDRIAKPSGN